MSDVQSVPPIIEEADLKAFKLAFSEVGEMLPGGDHLDRWIRFFFWSARVAPGLFNQVQNLKMESPEDVEIMGLTLGQLRKAISFAKQHGWAP